MSDQHSPASGKEAKPSSPAQESGDGFRADLPLAILESVRQHDRPSEVLEDEDLTVSLPRRLGLTGVVESQIHRYRTARKRREKIPFGDVVDLLRLVLRRPDAEAILREAGIELARSHSHRPLNRATSLARILPDTLSQRAARSSIRSLTAHLGGGVPFRTTLNPFRVTAPEPVTARAGEDGIACVLYTAAIEEAVHQAMGQKASVDHVACSARGAEDCVWEVA